MRTSTPTPTRDLPALGAQGAADRDRSPAPAGAAPLIAVLVVSAFVMILNETLLSVALPSLMADLSITAVTAQWLSTGFMLTMAVVIPTTGFLMTRLSVRHVFMIAMGLFLIGTLAAMSAPGFPVLLGARMVQAAGTAMVLPLLMTTILALVPIRSRGLVMGLVGVVISAAPALGPSLSGFILEHRPGPGCAPGRRCHRACTAAGPVAVRVHPRAPLLALPVRDAAADHRHRPGHRAAVHALLHRAGEGTAGRALGGALRDRLRR